MGMRETIERNALVILCGVAIASGGVVASVMQYLHNNSVERIKSQHQLDLEKLERSFAELNADLVEERQEISNLRTTLQDSRLKEAFTSLHSRILTYDSINETCSVFNRGFGEILNDIEWSQANLLQTASSYEKMIDALEERGLAEINIPRAGPNYLAFVDGGTWPIADLRGCIE